ncbi:manganese efflux pump [Cryptobacterium curtum]
MLCGAMIIIGRCLGASFGRRAQIVGGIVLILLGAKAFFF